jgi:hypothetical protein
VDKYHLSEPQNAPVCSSEINEDEMVRATMRGIKRVHDTAQRQAKTLLRDDLFPVLDTFGDG